MRVERFEALEDVKPIWDQLFAHAAFPSPFLEYRWAESWWQHFHPTGLPGRALYILAAYAEDGTPIGLLPLYFSVPEYRGSAVRLRQLGDLVQDEGLTEEPIILLRADYSHQEILDAFVRYVRSDMRIPVWDVLTVRWQSANRPGPHQKGGRRRVLEGRQSAPVHKNWVAFRASLTKTVRKNLVYYPHKLDKSGVKWSVRFITERAESAEAIDRMVELHRARAVSDRGPEHVNHVPSKLQASFLRETLGGLMGRKEAFIAVLLVGGVIIAAQSMLRYEDGLMYYYSGFDPVWYDFSPLTILSKEIIELAIKHQFAGIEYLFTSAQWKRRWGAKQTSWLAIDTFYNSSASSWLRLAWNFVCRILEWYGMREIVAKRLRLNEGSVGA